MKKQKTSSHSYIVANDADELWGLFVTSIGFQSIPPNSGYPPKGHPSAYWFNPRIGRALHDYQIVYISKGEGVFQSVNCNVVNVNAGNALLLFPGEWHTYHPSTKTGWDEYWIGFNGENIDRLLSNNFFSKKQPVLDVGFNEYLISLYKQGIEVANYQRTAFQPMLAGIAQLLLGFMFYTERNNSFRDKDIITKIDQARMMMRENTFNVQSLEKMASQLNMSYSWFRRIFKQYTGFAPAQYQMEIRMQKAKELLTSTAISIKEIAYELGFDSVSYFVTFFKTKTGISPKVYRDKVHSNNPHK